jgi:hypothetical protein
MSTIKTRSGRQIKKPDRYEPVERCTDDYTDDEEDDEGEDIISESDYSTEEEEDADDSGNLKGFIVSDEDDDDEDEDEDEA